MLPFLNVCVLHNERSVTMFVSPDQTFFVTVAALKVLVNRDQTECSEAELALLLSHELAHYLLDHTVTRIGTSLLFNWMSSDTGHFFKFSTDSKNA
jgi:hypothetical protein